MCILILNIIYYFIPGKKSDVLNSQSYIPTVFKGVDEAKGKVRKSPRKTSTSEKAGTITAPSITGLKNSKFRRRKRKVKTKEQLTLGRPKNLNIKPKDESSLHVHAVWNTTDHDYVRSRDEKAEKVEKSSSPGCCDKELESLKERLRDMERERFEETETLKQRINYLERENRKIISLDTVTDIQKWTSLPNRAVFNALAKYLKKRGEKLRYWLGNSTTVHSHYEERMSSKPGPKRKMSFEDQLFMTLVKLKCGFYNNQIAHIFGVAESVVSQIIFSDLHGNRA